jgi:large subunit ribosomal protein L13e
MGFSSRLSTARFNKDWQEKVKTFFNQPGTKLRRRKVRAAKAKRLGSNPTHSLRPAVRGQTRRYNNKLKLGKGFTLDELKKAGIRGVNYARSIGISVDLRRKDTNAEAQKINVDRIKEYVSKMILYPKKKPEGGKPQVLEATPDQIKFSETLPQNISKAVIPLPKSESAFSFGEVTTKLRDEIVYKTLRKEWKLEHKFAERLEKRKKRLAEKKR